MSSDIILKTQQLSQEIASTYPLDAMKMDAFWAALNDLQVKFYLQITGLDFLGEPDGDESITITNRGHVICDISQWQINAGSPHQDYIFPEDTLLRGGESVTVYTRPGARHSFNSNRSIWNNNGDTATLFNQSGEVISTWLYGKAAHMHVPISNVHYKGDEFRTEGDEYVELTNISEHRIDITGWQLTSESNTHSFTFPSGAIIEPSGTVRVYTNRPPSAANEYSANSPKAIWNNRGGMCVLSDYLGYEIAFFAY
ncbi:lamin tail domain-containing protein [Vibrio sp. MEBiC08052]|uniref:lamin tail domain-containing protein n=1 Tax=Vibrio sp. MEBiC08052 TaxID=1761910 RepID=UPI0007406676|nr:lamin tail domain-containing protein [Vibrio sp. MEBiC08052]KUI97877.1 hypothetical protein VRK_25780 [Vibrio sp. MEBiC08052]